MDRGSGKRGAYVVRSNPHQLQRERPLILGMLLVLAVIAWVLLIWQAARMNNAQAMGLTMGVSAALFIALWVVMMIAMMFPTAVSMILTFRTVSTDKQQEHSFITTWIFVGAYLLVWSLSGVLAYVFALGIEELAGQSMWLMMNAARFGGVVLVMAGLYQFSSLKRICLSKCRMPLQCILDTWRDGYSGAFHMGLEHGAFCLGCCWLLFVILFPLGIMNITAMILVTMLIYAEKSLPLGRQIGMVAGGGLIIYGILVLFWPALLPMRM
jgi:predicted metal-binding membrane protein